MKQEEEEEKSTTLSSCRTSLQQLRPEREEKCDKNKFKDGKLLMSSEGEVKKSNQKEN